MKKLQIFLLISIIVGLLCWFGFLISRGNLQLLDPHGLIAIQERNLIVGAAGFMLAIAIPIIIIAFIISYKFRSSGKNSTHMPDLIGSKKVIAVYWGFLISLALIFFVVVWISAHRLDPSVPIKSSAKPLEVQVVALQWKWLFIYPEQNIATVNFLQVPVNTPIIFKLTADGPMNSFWIPSLSGQIYAMTSMETKINMIANSIGDYPGGAAEINGKGFSGMRFITKVTSKDKFDEWVINAQNNMNPLDENTFRKLSNPSEDNPIAVYSLVENRLYDSIIMKYMTPPTNEKSKDQMGGMIK